MSKFCNNNSPLPASLAETAEATLAAIESVLISHLILASCAWVFWSLGGSWRGGGGWFQWHFSKLNLAFLSRKWEIARAHLFVHA